MSKIFKKITSIAMAGVMATSMAVAVSAACPPHVTFYKEVGTAYDVYAGHHTYVLEYRYDSTGNRYPIEATCYMRSVGKKYEYKCEKCGTVTSSGVSSKLIHSSCGE